MRNASKETSEIVQALISMQKEIKPAVKNSTMIVRGGRQSKYADLSAVWDSIRVPLCNNNLCVLQLPFFTKDGLPYLVTRVVHSSGQWIESEIMLSLSDGTPHAMGSALTYARRYALASLIGVCTEDDDAQEAQSYSVASSKRTSYQSSFIDIEDILNKSGISVDREKMDAALIKFGARTPNDLPEDVKRAFLNKIKSKEPRNVNL